MKKISKLLVLLILAIACTILFTGCNSTAKNVIIKTEMNTTTAFNGKRVTTCVFPNKLISTDEKEKNLESVIKSFVPDSMTYVKEIINEGIQYTFTIEFTSKDDYISKIKTVIGREPAVMFVLSDTILAKGWRFLEDFDTVDLLRWIPEGLESRGIEDIELAADVQSTMVNMEGTLEKSGSTIDINKMKGYAVKGVSVETTNYKNYVYDRKIKMIFPQDTFDKIGNELKTYLKERTRDDCEYATWAKEGNYQSYEVYYKNMTIYELAEYTNLMFDSIDCTAEYGDSTNSSTALAEQLTFKEKLNLLCYVGENDKNLEIEYKYTVVGNTTYGEGSVYKQGEWNACGKWQDGIYTMKTNDSSLYISIPDGTQYEIEALYITLESQGNDKFMRIMDFIYDADTGEKGLAYAYQYFKDKDVDVEKLKSDPYMICRVRHSGSSKKLSGQLGNLFGGGNYVSYSTTDEALSIVNTTQYSENINISYMLTGKNAQVPIVYTVYEKGSESIRSLEAKSENFEAKGKQKEDNRNQVTVNLKSGDSQISFTGVVPNGLGIFVYCLIGFMMIAAALFMIINNIKKNKQKMPAHVTATSNTNNGNKKKFTVANKNKALTAPKQIKPKE